MMNRSKEKAASTIADHEKSLRQGEKGRQSIRFYQINSYIQLQRSSCVRAQSPTDKRWVRSLKVLIRWFTSDTSFFFITTSLGKVRFLHNSLVLLVSTNWVRLSLCFQKALRIDPGTSRQLRITYSMILASHRRFLYLCCI